ncbi:hypothetical protein SETIT_6G242700v2 [Setaria italica]|uniref:Uncharacterized protein n=1 Tax=Setaria italica TaxID=4555 RepID=A0A368RQ22_SETIT|nr:hypothetical protein SETIT_6G242700v2 [Setaria italica]
MASHLRSASLPSSPCSNKAEVEQQLQSLKTTMASSSATIDMMCDGLWRLGNLYSEIEEMMKAVEEELGWSLVLLDLCNAMQENFIEMMMKVQELLFSLKRGDDAAAQLKAYIQITNKAHKQFKKVCKKTTSDEKDCRVIKLLAEARSITTSVLEYTSCLLLVCEEEQLKALECSIGDLESGVDLLFRRLIQCRVSLLNTLSS